MTPLQLSDCLEAAENGNHSAEVALWNAYAAATGKPALSGDRNVPEICAEAAVEWGRKALDREVRAARARQRAREMSAELPPEQADVMRLKGMI